MGKEAAKFASKGVNMLGASASKDVSVVLATVNPKN